MLGPGQGLGPALTKGPGKERLGLQGRRQSWLSGSHVGKSAPPTHTLMSHPRLANGRAGLLAHTYESIRETQGQQAFTDLGFN